METLEVLKGVASALVYLHNFRRSPIVHAKLKPSNIILNAVSDNVNINPFE